MNEKLSYGRFQTQAEALRVLRQANISLKNKFHGST